MLSIVIHITLIQYYILLLCNIVHIVMQYSVSFFLQWYISLLYNTRGFTSRLDTLGSLLYNVTYQCYTMLHITVVQCCISLLYKVAYHVIQCCISCYTMLHITVTQRIICHFYTMLHTLLYNTAYHFYAILYICVIQRYIIDIQYNYTMMHMIVMQLYFIAKNATYSYYMMMYNLEKTVNCCKLWLLIF